MIDLNTFLTINRPKGFLTLGFLVLSFLVPFTYHENDCKITGVGFPAPAYIKTKQGCPPSLLNIRDFYGLNILSTGFNLILAYLLACLSYLLYTRYEKKD